MRLLNVVPTYLPAVRYGGTVRAVHGICRALASRGHAVTVYTSTVDGPSRIEVGPGQPVFLDGVEVRYFPALLQRPCWSPAMGRALARHVRDFDLVLIHSVFLWPTWAAARISHASGVPYVIAPHGMLVPELVLRKNRLLKTAWISLVERRNLERAAAIHVTSGIEADDLRRFGFRLRRVFVVPHGVEETQDFDPRDVTASVTETLARRPLLLFLGRVNWKKGLDRLIAALPQVPSAHLAVAGGDEGGLTSSLSAQARQLGLAGRVTFLGHVEGANKAALLAGADVFALPSESENFGCAVLEAMAAGLAVVVSPGVGLAPEVRNSEAGLVVERDPSSLAAAFRTLLGSAELRRQMGARGRAAVAARYRWDRVGEALEQALIPLIRTRDSASTRSGATW